MKKHFEVIELARKAERYEDVLKRSSSLLLKNKNVPIEVKVAFHIIRRALEDI